MIGSGTVTKTWDSSNLLCYNESYTATYSKSGTGNITKPTCFTFNAGPGAPSIQFNCADNAMKGIYTITITGTLGSPPAGMSPTSSSFSFVVTVETECINTAWVQAGLLII